MRRRHRPSPQTLAVLLALAAKPERWWSHGYHRCRSLDLKPGMVDPIFIRLAERGLLVTVWEEDPPKRCGAAATFLGSSARLPAERSRAGPVTPKRAARIAAFVTVGVMGGVSFGRAAMAGVWDLLINAPFLTALLGGPLAAAAGIMTYRWRAATASPETDVARSSDEWIAAVRSEFALHRSTRGPAWGSGTSPVRV